MVMNRRQWMRAATIVGAAGMLLTTSLRALAVSRPAFEATAVDDALAKLFGGKPVEDSARISFQIPDIAENGAVVPVSVATDLEGVTAISIVVDRNPNPVVARFVIGPDAVADVSARIKMGESSRVRAFVETADRIYSTGREVKVTIGGCGG
jgi:sulfur-oxidizing protein SoxY